jgi:hypothetical protein
MICANCITLAASSCAANCANGGVRRRNLSTSAGSGSCLAGRAKAHAELFQVASRF